MKIKIIIQLTAVFLIQLLCIMQLEACILADTVQDTAAHHVKNNEQVQFSVLNIVKAEVFNQSSFIKNKSTSYIQDKTLAGIEMADLIFNTYKNNLCLQGVLSQVPQNLQRFYAYLNAADLRAPPAVEKYGINIHFKPNC